MHVTVRGSGSPTHQTRAVWTSPVAGAGIPRLRPGIGGLLPPCRPSPRGLLCTPIVSPDFHQSTQISQTGIITAYSRRLERRIQPADIAYAPGLEVRRRSGRTCSKRAAEPFRAEIEATWKRCAARRRERPVSSPYLKSWRSRYVCELSSTFR